MAIFTPQSICVYPPTFGDLAIFIELSKIPKLLPGDLLRVALLDFFISSARRQNDDYYYRDEIGDYAHR
ncbi:MAG: hypothetical protein COA78_05605 [Blastopirellula sp.]|nr:MAG: hypothetical protein COA78_05605 [Blastopirellula sp.]